jgi:O-antigen/teichoic acid export membrane protein
MLLIIVGRLVHFALLLLTLRVATELLLPSEMGKIAIVTATVAFFALIFVNPVGMFVNRRVHAWNAGGRAKTYYSYFWLYLVAVSGCASLALFALNWLDWWKPSVGIYWLIMLVSGNLFIGTVNQMVIPGLNMFGFSGWFISLTITTTATSLMCAVLLARGVSPSAEYWLCGLLMGQLIVGVLGTKVFFDRLQGEGGGSFSNLSPHQFKSLFGFAWPVSIAVGLGWVQGQGYRYIMEGRIGLVELGLFVAGFGISAGLISAVDTIFATYYQPKFYARITGDNPNEQSHAWVEYAQAILPALLLTGIFIMATASELTDLLLGDSYRQSAKFVIWGALTELTRLSTAVFGMAAHARMHTKLLLLPNLVGAVGAMVLIGWLAPVYGSDGVGMGLACASLGGLLMAVYMTARYLEIVLPLNLLATSALMGGVVFVVAYCLDYSFPSGESRWVSFVRLCIVGTIFLGCQYAVLLPTLKKTSLR